MHRLLATAAAFSVTLAVAACASDSSDSTLSPEAQQGHDVARTNGCAACHGSDGEGGVGPPFTGLYGATVNLADGTSVVADEAYLFEAIREPDAKRVDGYDVPMPSNDLSDAEIEQVIAYIRELSTSAPSQP